MCEKNNKLTIHDYLETYLKENNMSIRAFASKAGLSRSYAHYLVKGERENAGISILEKIAKATDITLEELMSLVYFKDEENQTEKDRKIRRIVNIVNQIEDSDDLDKIIAYLELFSK